MVAHLQDGRGIVCADDVRHALKASGDNLPEEELQGVFASLDTRGNGSITIDEFEAAALEAPHALNDARLKATFDFMDANGDGCATLDVLFLPSFLVGQPPRYDSASMAAHPTVTS
jgi:hypothetical protein